MVGVVVVVVMVVVVVVADLEAQESLMQAAFLSTPRDLLVHLLF